MPGLFIQRQVEILAADNDVVVLLVQEDLGSHRKYEVVVTVEAGVKVVRVYYLPPANYLGTIAKVVKFYRFLRAHQLGFKQVKGFLPNLIHVHVLTRHGVIALWRKLLIGTPYVITEHWSRYFTENGTYRGIFRKWITQQVVKNSLGLIAVSEKLKSAMLHQGLDTVPFDVIGNPVDMLKFTHLVKTKREQHVKTRIIHVSCFEDKSKNISGFLRIMSRILENTPSVECRLIGEGPDLERCENFADTLGLPKDLVVFCGLKEGDELVKEFQEADFLVLSSRYETFGTVIVEAMACGIPVVTTDVGIASEVIDAVSGMVVPVGDEPALEKAIRMMITDHGSLERTIIRNRVVNRFSTEQIGRQTEDFYSRVLKTNTKV